MVALDVGRTSRIRCGNLDRLGHYVNAAARLAQHVVAQDDRIGLVVFGDQPLVVVPPTRGLVGVIRIRELLSRVQSQTTDSNVIHAAAQVLKRVHQRSLVVLMTDIDDASSEGPLAAALRRKLTRSTQISWALVASNCMVSAMKSLRGMARGSSGTAAIRAAQ